MALIHWSAVRMSDPQLPSTRQIRTLESVLLRINKEPCVKQNAPLLLTLFTRRNPACLQQRVRAVL